VYLKLVLGHTGRMTVVRARHRPTQLISV